MITVSVQQDTTILSLHGRIDSVNAPALEKDVFAQIDFALCRYLVIDAQHLTMISSAGLRIILKLRKKCGSLTIRDVSPDVYDVLEMTGFTEMMKVEKAYRQLSVDGCEVLGEGANGVVYRYNPEIVVKVYKKADALAAIKRERNLARRALVLGIPTAIPFDVVKVGNSYGSVFELLDAQSFSVLIAAEPDRLDEYAQHFVKLLKKIHTTRVEPGELTDAKHIALSWAKHIRGELPEQAHTRLTALIQAAPDRKTMIHGDFHTGNVEMQSGEVLLIDMDTLSYGHPVFEFASMYLAFVGFGELDHTVTEQFLKLPWETSRRFWRRLLELYFGTTDEARIRAIEDKARVIGYTRMMRRAIRLAEAKDPTGPALVEHCRKQLTELLESVATLAF